MDCHFGELGVLFLKKMNKTPTLLISNIIQSPICTFIKTMPPEDQGYYIAQCTLNHTSLKEDSAYSFLENSAYLGRKCLRQ